jgi:hypothetical protein
MADNEDDLVDYDEEEVRACCVQCGSRSQNIRLVQSTYTNYIMCVYGCKWNIG